MWVFASFGLLMPSTRPTKYTPAWDDRKLQIRARRAKDLDILRAKYMSDSLGETIHTPDKDYEYRAYCTHEAWAIGLMKMSLDINYDKFKPTANRDHVYHTVLNSIWSVVINGLSTKKHQQEYWHSRGSDDWDWRPSRYRDDVSTGVVSGSSKKAPGKSGTGWPDDPPQHSYVPSSKNGPEDIRPRSPLVSGGGARRDITDADSDWRDCRQPKPSGYAAGNYASSYPDSTGYMADRYSLPSTPSGGISLEKRNTSADRDETEPEVWEVAASDITAGLSADALSDDDWRTLEALLDSLPSTDDGARPDPILEGLDIVTRAHLEIDDLTRSLGDRMSHSACDHGWSPNARSRCRRKHNNAVIKRIEEIEALIEEVEAERRHTEQPALTG